MLGFPMSGGGGGRALSSRPAPAGRGAWCAGRGVRGAAGLSGLQVASRGRPASDAGPDGRDGSDGGRGRHAVSPGGAPGQPCGQTWPPWPRPPRPRPSPRPASACVVLPAPDQVHPRDADLSVGAESPGPGTASLRAGVTGGRWERRPVRPRKSLAPRWPFPESAGVRPSLTGSATFTALSKARRRPGSRLARALRARASNASPTASSSLSHVSAEARSRSRVAAESTGCHAGRHRSAVGGGSVHGHNVDFQVPDESDVCVFWTGRPGSEGKAALLVTRPARVPGPGGGDVHAGGTDGRPRPPLAQRDAGKGLGH